MKRALVFAFQMGEKVSYEGREWMVLSCDRDFAQIVAVESGYKKEVMVDLLRPVEEVELTEGSWDIAALAAEVRAKYGYKR